MMYEDFLNFCKMSEWEHRENYNIRKQQEFVVKYLTPIKYRGVVHDTYFLDKDGDFWSRKNNGRVVKLAIDYNSKYPKVKFRNMYNTLCASLHRIVCETFHEVPLPNGVTFNEWKRTPKSVKKCFDQYWEVNHIDHDPMNYHPSNLEWVSRSENVKKYQEYKKDGYIVTNLIENTKNKGRMYNA